MEYIYREMLEDSPIAYAHIKFYKETEHEFNKFRVLDMNRSFRVMYKISEDNNKINYLKDVTRDKEESLWQKIYKEAEKNKKAVRRIPIAKLGTDCNVEVYTDKKMNFI